MVFGGGSLCACAFVLSVDRLTVVSDGKVCCLLEQGVRIDRRHGSEQVKLGGRSQK